MSKEQFIEAFVTRMLKHAKQFDCGEDVEPYARKIAPAYYDDVDTRKWGPEECAKADIEEWERVQ